jgi:carboxylesterase type B
MLGKRLYALSIAWLPFLQFTHAVCSDLGTPPCPGNPVFPCIRIGNTIYSGTARTIPSSTSPAQETTVGVFYGMPYAQPARRWTPAEPWRAAQDAGPTQNLTRLAPTCIQARDTRLERDDAYPGEQEDCLTMNVYVPCGAYGTTSKKGLPIMVFLIGGGLQSADTNSYLYDALHLAGRQEVLVVVPNYRTNVFGFPGVTNVARGQAMLNLGLEDQRTAIRFVKRIATDINGDPNRITLFGQSAGARSIDFHLLTWGLGNNGKRTEELPFRAAIMQSGSSELVPLADWRKDKAGGPRGADDIKPFLKLAELVGCSSHAVDKGTISCMRDMPVGILKRAIVDNDLYFPSVNDFGYSTVADQALVRRNGFNNKIPVLMGTNANEQSGLVHRDLDMDLDTYLDRAFPVGMGYPPTAVREDIKKAYGDKFPNERFKTTKEAITALETEFAYICLTSREAKLIAQGASREFAFAVGMC